jgi:hypothetical protein
VESAVHSLVKRHFESRLKPLELAVVVAAVVVVVEQLIVVVNVEGLQHLAHFPIKTLLKFVNLL